MNSAKPMIASGAKKTHFFLIVSPSSIRKFVVDRLQPFAEMKHGITFPREQGVDADSGRCGDVFETSVLEFMCHENGTLLFRQFADCEFQFLKNHVANEKFVWPGIRGWKKLFQSERLVIFVNVLAFAEALRLLL